MDKPVKSNPLPLAVIFAALAMPCGAQATRIDHAKLESMFADMQAHAPWNLGGDLLWGYYFVSSNKAELAKAGAELTAQGYHLVEIRQLQSGTAGNPPSWQLHVERVEHHTVDSLDLRDNELYKLADAHRQVTYDGMDVGPVP